MFNSKKILPALAVAAIFSAGSAISSQAIAGIDAGYLDFSTSQSYASDNYSSNYGAMNPNVLADGNLFEGQISDFTSGYRAPSSGSHASPSVVDRTSTGVIHQYYDVNDPGYNYRDPDPIRVEIKYNDVYANAYSVAESSSQGYIAPRDMKDVYNSQFFAGYTYDSDGHRDRAVYRFTDGSNTYYDYFNSAHYEKFAEGTISHNEIVTTQAMGNLETDTSPYNYNNVDWNAATTGGISGSTGGNNLDFSGYSSSLFDNINIGFGSGSANSNSGLSQYLGGNFSGSSNNVSSSNLGFGTALSKPVGNLSNTGKPMEAFIPTLSGLGSIEGLNQLQSFYDDFAGANYLDQLPGGMGDTVSNLLSDAAGSLGDAAAEAGGEFFGSLGDSFDDFSFGDFSFDSFGDFSFGDLGMGDMFEGFDLGSLDFVGDFDFGSITDSLDMGGMFDGMLEGFDLGSILDTSELTGQLTDMISSEISGLVGDMFGDFLGSFDIGGMIGDFLG